LNERAYLQEALFLDDVDNQVTQPDVPNASSNEVGYASAARPAVAIAISNTHLAAARVDHRGRVQ
jgi:hypothetical protein